MIYTCKPSKIAIYVNSSRKSISAIKRELGCDAIINGGLYDMSTWTPCGFLRVDGATKHRESWFTIGCGWGEDNKLVMTHSDNMDNFRNYLSCVALIYGGDNALYYDKATLGGRRGRSAIGMKADGTLVLYCTQDGLDATTPEQLQTQMLSLGCVSALMLDGGASCHCVFPSGIIPANKNRPFVHNYIAVWTEQGKNDCPYPAPTRNLGYYSRGDDVRWLQWQLIRRGHPLSGCDGILGPNTLRESLKFAVEELKK